MPTEAERLTREAQQLLVQQVLAKISPLVHGKPAGQMLEVMLAVSLASIMSVSNDPRDQVKLLRRFQDRVGDLISTVRKSRPANDR